ncbi:glycerophosphodiester phosphodiesterase family protein [Candidatus Saccharibacteria bacterium]|nr:glycerophosphodiester phosphodiesterase family protein [Candidatus Saccharibacteria bacterium]
MNKILTALVAAVMLVSSGISPLTPDAKALTTRQILASRCVELRTVAHRGYTGSLYVGPNEDTLESMQRAFAYNADASETDWRMSADRTWYQMHDATVSRTTNGSGYISDLTDQQIAGLSTAAKQHVPTFEETIQLFATYNNGAYLTEGRLLQFELKQDSVNVVADVADFQRMLDIVDTYGVRSNISWSSTSMANLEKMHSIAPEMEYQLIAGSGVRPKLSTMPQWISQINVTTRVALTSYGGYSTYIRAGHASGFKISARGADSIRRWRRLTLAGADQIVTNRIGSYDSWCKSLQ